MYSSQSLFVLIFKVHFLFIISCNRKAFALEVRYKYESEKSKPLFHTKTNTISWHQKKISSYFFFCIYIYTYNLLSYFCVYTMHLYHMMLELQRLCNCLLPEYFISNFILLYFQKCIKLQRKA